MMLHEPVEPEPILVIEPLPDSPSHQGRRLVVETAWERAQIEFNRAEFDEDGFRQCHRWCKIALTDNPTRVRWILVHLLMARTFKMENAESKNSRNSHRRFMRAFNAIKTLNDHGPQPSEWSQLHKFLVPMAQWYQDNPDFRHQLVRAAQLSSRRP